MKDMQELEEYILALFKIDFIGARIRKQIAQYIKEYHYSYSGIRKALYYFYEIKGNSIDKANGGIGIIPYIYNEAYNYFFTIWKAQEVNNNKNIEKYVPSAKEIVIKNPERKIKKRKLFSFLDEVE